MQLTKDILEDVFRTARKVKTGQITLAQGGTILVGAHRLNQNSAAMMLRSLVHLHKGERYRRALTIGATDYFLTRIREEDGQAGLQTALRGLSAHIDYRESSGVRVPGLQSILAKAERVAHL